MVVVVMLMMVMVVVVMIMMMMRVWGACVGDGVCGEGGGAHARMGGGAFARVGVGWGVCVYHMPP